MEEFGESLKKARKSAGFTQKQVEKLLELRPLMIRDYETQRLKLPVEMSVKLSQLYRVSISELLGVGEVHSQEAGLEKFKSLFKQNRTQLLFLDPVIRAYLENFLEDIFSRSIFEILTHEFSKREIDELVVELGKLLCALAASDNQITTEEVECINYLMVSLGMEKQLKIVKPFLESEYKVQANLKSLRSPQIKHFVVWILFIFAESDNEIRIEEINFIEDIAQKIKINRSNFINIKDKFVKEKE